MGPEGEREWFVERERSRAELERPVEWRFERERSQAEDKRSWQEREWCRERLLPGRRDPDGD